MFLPVYLFCLCLTFLSQCIINPSKLQDKPDTTTIYHVGINTLNVFIQNALMDYFVIYDPEITLVNVFFAPILYFILQDIYFYVMHRFMHSKYVYKYFHKVHHEIKNPNIYVAYYEHPIDHIIVWTVPYIILPNLISINYYSYMFFLFFTTLISIEAHSGNSLHGRYWYIGRVYTKVNEKDIYIYNHTPHHDMHHELTNCNYGLWTTFMDRICNTLNGDYDSYAKKLYEQN